jgi:hypothetical protein
MLPAILLGVAGVALLSDSNGAGVGGGAVLIGVAVVVFCVGVVLSNALRQVFAVALYRYTTSGEVAQGFDSIGLIALAQQRAGGLLEDPAPGSRLLAILGHAAHHLAHPAGRDLDAVLGAGLA